MSSTRKYQRNVTRYLHWMLEKQGVLALALIFCPCVGLTDTLAKFSEPAWGDELVAAIKTDDVGVVERLYFSNSISSDAVLNTNALTPLMVAALNGSDGVARFLLERGAKANARSVLKDPDQFPPVADVTALHIACARNRAGIVKLLMAHGADLDQKDDEGNTPFMLACAKGHLEMTKLLVKHGAKVNALNSHGWTPLYTAAQYDQTEVAAFLISRGANVSSGPSRSPLMRAAERGNEPLVRLLIENGAHVNPTNLVEECALIDAAVEGHNSIVQLLIQKGARIDQQTETGWTALIQAAAHGHCETVKTLCKAGADPTRANKFGHTAFDYAEGLTGTNVLTKHSDLRPLVDNGSIAQDDLYYVMLHINSPDGFACVKKVLVDYMMKSKQRPKTKPAASTESLP